MRPAMLKGTFTFLIILSLILFSVHAKGDTCPDLFGPTNQSLTNESLITSEHFGTYAEQTPNYKVYAFLDRIKDRSFYSRSTYEQVKLQEIQDLFKEDRKAELVSITGATEILNFIGHGQRIPADPRPILVRLLTKLIMGAVPLIYLGYETFGSPYFYVVLAVGLGGGSWVVNNFLQERNLAIEQQVLIEVRKSIYKALNPVTSLRSSMALAEGVYTMGIQGKYHYAIFFSSTAEGPTLDVIRWKN